MQAGKSRDTCVILSLDNKGKKASTNEASLRYGTPNLLWHLPMGPTQHTNNPQGQRRRIPRVVSITETFAEPYHCHPRSLARTAKGKNTLPLRLQRTKTPPQNQNHPPSVLQGRPCRRRHGSALWCLSVLDPSCSRVAPVSRTWICPTIWRIFVTTDLVGVQRADETPPGGWGVVWGAWRLLRRRLVALQWVQRARVGVLSLSERVGADVSGDVPLCGGGWRWS